MKFNLRKTLLTSTVLISVAGLSQQAMAQISVDTGGSGVIATDGGLTDNVSDISITGTGDAITVATGQNVTNNGADGDGAGPNESVILLNDATPADNTLTLTNSSTIEVTGGTGSAVLVSQEGTITLSTSNGVIQKTTAGATGNAINSSAVLTLNNAGTVTAAFGDGTIVSSGNLTIDNTGAITNTEAGDADDDAIRVTGTANAAITLQSGSSVSSTAGAAIDLATTTGTQAIDIQDDATISGDILLGNNASVSVQFTGDGITSYSDNITGTGAGTTSLTVNRTGATNIVNLTGTISEVDTLTVTDGELDLDANIVVGVASVASGGILDIAGMTSFEASTSFDVAGTLDTVSAAVVTGNLDINDDGTISGDLTFDDGADSVLTFDGNDSDDTVTIAGALSGGTEAGADSLVVNRGDANDVVVLSGAVSEFETLTVTSGELDLDGTIADVVDVSVAASGTLDIAGLTNNVFAPTTSFTVAGTLQTAAATVVSGDITVNADGTISGDLTFDDGADSALTFGGDDSNDELIISGAINGGTEASSDTIVVNRTDANDVVTLNGAISEIEAITVTQGSLTFGASATLADGPAITVTNDDTVTFNNTNGASLVDVNLNGNNSSVTFNASGATFDGAISDASSAAETQTVTLTDGTVSGAINLSNGNDAFAISGGTFSGSYTGGAGADVITVTGGVVSGTFSDAGGTSSIFNVDSNLTLSGSADIDGFALDIDNNATLTVSNTGGVGASTALDAVTIASGSTLVANTDVDAATGTLTNNGTLQIANGATVTAGDYADASGASIIFVADLSGSTTSTGTLNAGSAVAADFANTTITISGTSASGTVAGIITNVALNSATDGVSVSGSSSTLSYSLVGNGSNTDLVIATSSAVNDVLTGTFGSSTSSAISDVIALGTVSNTGLQTFIDSVTNASGADEVGRIVEGTLAPLGSSTAQATVNVAGATNVSVGQRTAYLRGYGDSSSGMSAGNAAMGMRAWSQAFGSTGKQNSRSNIAGYDVDSYGITGGLDTYVSDNFLLGLAFTYAQTDLESADSGNTETEVDTYQVTLYGEHEIHRNMYINGQLGYALSKNAVVRTFPTSRSFEYDSDQFNASTEMGVNLRVGRSAYLVPHAGVSYVYYNADSYTDPTAGGVRVDTDELSVLEGIVGADFEKSYYLASGSIVRPRLSADYSYDFIGDEVAATSQFVGGGQAFGAEGFESQDHSVNVGAGISVLSTSNWELSADYDYEWKEDFDAHSGRVKAAYSF